jgi:hypothetical protein
MATTESFNIHQNPDQLLFRMATHSNIARLPCPAFKNYW